MPGKRKDNKGRILKTGETQRKNGTYDYRYTDIHKKRQSIYAKTLEELRKEEENIARDIADGIDYAGGCITVAQLVKRCLNLKRNLRHNSTRAYGTVVKYLDANEFGMQEIKSVKLSDAKGWFVSLHDDGYKRNTIGVFQSVVRPAFEMAVDDDLIRKNPFKFNLADLLSDDALKREALTKTQQEKYLGFAQVYGHANYYDDIVILLGTGLRVSELYGLTKYDLDLDNRRINIERQLCRTAERPYFITPPKSNSGIRCIPMTETVYEAVLRVLKNRGTCKVEQLIDGCSGFLFLDRDGMPKVAMHLENYMRGLQQYYSRRQKYDLPNITPHVLRHTFCTAAQQAQLDIKSLQYIMGHSNASITLDVYSHVDLNAVELAFSKIATNL